MENCVDKIVLDLCSDTDIFHWISENVDVMVALEDKSALKSKVRWYLLPVTMNLTVHPTMVEIFQSG